MTTEDLSTHESAQDAQNRELLRNSELGVILEDAYDAAVNLDPRLQEVQIVPITDPEDKRFAHARPAWARNNTSGRHEMHVRTEDLDATLAMYQNVMDQTPDNTRIIAERLGVEPAEVTPQLLFVQSLIHEMGHITEFMDHEVDPSDLVHRIKAEKAAMPAGAMSVGSMLDPDSPARAYLDTHWDHVHAHTGAGSLDELVGMQTEAYRDLTSEQHADMFASDAFAYNPQMYGQLMNPDIEEFRNFPIAT